MSKKLLHSLDGYFSKFIRQRDLVNGIATCFTCGKKDSWQNMDCGHFIPRGYIYTRFNEINCQVQCKECNQFKNGNLEVFEMELTEKYGIEKVNELKDSKFKIRKYRDFELKSLIEYYK
jgi:hypothetical protein